MKVYHGTLTRFKRFDRAFTCDMGFHFGDSDQARSRLARIDEPGVEWVIMECELRVSRMIEGMPDVGDWSDHTVVSQAILDTQDNEGLRTIANKYVTVPYKFFGREPHEDMRDELVNAGFDGITYQNVAEGPGKSFLVFEPENIIIEGQGEK